MLRVNGVFVALGGKTILQEATFSARDGEKIGLIGDNGAGKTTLLRLIVGEIAPDAGSIEGTPKGRKVGFVPQHISLGRTASDLTVLAFMRAARQLDEIQANLTRLQNVLEGKGDDPIREAHLTEFIKLDDEYRRRRGPQAEEDIRRLLAGVGLDDGHLGQRVSTLSGGQKSRLMLARSLYDESDLLLLDEPTNHIGESQVGWLSKYLVGCRQTVIVVSHLPHFLDTFIQRILLLDRLTGRLKSFPGNYSRFLQVQATEGKRTAKEGKKLAAEIARRKRFIESATLSRARQKHAREKQLAKLEQSRPAARPAPKRLRFAFPAVAQLHSTAFKLEGVAMSFGERNVFSGLSLEVGPADRLGIVGVNGAGKTTLLSILAGQTAPDEGHVKRNRKLILGWYRQEQEGLRDDATVFEEAAAVTPGLKERELRSALARFLFPADRLSQKVGTLSRGERARLALCKLMLSGPNCLLLDEPTNHLDQASQQSLQSTLADYPGALVVSSHDVDFLRALGIDWVLQLPDGRARRLDTIGQASEAPKDTPAPKETVTVEDEPPRAQRKQVRPILGPLAARLKRVRR